VIVAVIAVLVVQASVDQIVHVIAVRHQRMAAAIVAAGASDWRAFCRVGGADGDGVFVVVALVRVVQVAVVQEIDVIFVHDAQMAAVFAMGVLVVGVSGVVHFGHSPLK
jgi:hypothetical protein